MESILPHVKEAQSSLLLDAVNELSVNAVPKELRTADINSHYTVSVSRRGPDTWAVVHRGQVYNKNLKSQMERLPSGRTDSFLARHRFTLLEAVELAEKLAQTVTIQGVKASDIITHETWFDAYTAVAAEKKLKAAQKAEKQARKAAKNS